MEEDMRGCKRKTHPGPPCEGGGVEMRGMVCAVVVAGLVLGGCCTKKMSSDVAARDSMHRERREEVADSLCQKAMRDRVLESAAEVKIVIEEDFWAVPSCPDPKRDSLTGAPEERCPSPVWRRRTTITARKDVKETEKETEEMKTKTLTMTEELEDSVAEKEEHVKEEREGRTWWPWPQVVWLALGGWVLWRVWRRTHPGQSARRTGECSPHKAQKHIECFF